MPPRTRSEKIFSALSSICAGPSTGRAGVDSSASTAESRSPKTPVDDTSTARRGTCPGGGQGVESACHALDVGGAVVLLSPRPGRQRHDQIRQVEARKVWAAAGEVNRQTLQRLQGPGQRGVEARARRDPALRAACPRQHPGRRSRQAGRPESSHEATGEGSALCHRLAIEGSHHRALRSGRRHHTEPPTGIRTRDILITSDAGLSFCLSFQLHPWSRAASSPRGCAGGAQDHERLGRSSTPVERAPVAPARSRSCALETSLSPGMLQSGQPRLRNVDCVSVKPSIEYSPSSRPSRSFRSLPKAPPGRSAEAG